MRQITAFTKKEFMELTRTGKLMILTVLFVIFGIMSPAIAKLTPWLYEQFAGSMAEQGIQLANVEVTALTSWMQFYKNIPVALIVIVFMFCGILTTEYQKGTLINMLTKGLPRWKVIAAKGIAAVSVWTFCYWLCYGITYGYNVYFWDNSIAKHFVLGGVYIYLFGIWILSLIILTSTIFESSAGVLMMTGGTVVVSYLAGILPKVSEYVPTQLLGSGNLLSGAVSPADFTGAAVVTGVLTIVAFALAVPIFNKRRV